MATIDIMAGHFHFGTDGRDSISAGPGYHAVLGLGGDDYLESRGGDWEWSVVALAGGHGDDTYHADAEVTEIIESGGNDTLHVPGHANDYLGAFLDGHDLVLFNQWTEQIIIVMDFKGAGRIETFLDDYGNRMSGDAVQSAVYSQGYGDVSYQELQSFTGDYSLDGATYQALREIDIAMARLDWHDVFDTIAEQGNMENAVIADAIQAEIFQDLSTTAKQVWQDNGYYDALLASSFNGLEANLPDMTNDPAPHELAENVGLLYEAALDRMPDKDGLNYWVDQVASGMDMREVGLRFLDSHEFRENFEADSNEEFIDLMYANVLDRSPDPEGETFWLNELSSGAREPVDVLRGFADSPENREQAEWLAGLNFQESTGEWAF